MSPKAADLKNDLQSIIDDLLLRLKEFVPQEKKIALSTNHGIELVCLEEILRLESHNNYTTFWLTDKSKKIVSVSIGHFEELLIDFNFFRIHQSHIINLNHLRSYTKSDGGKATMMDGVVLEVSRRKKEAFLKCLTRQCI